MNRFFAYGIAPFSTLNPVMTVDEIKSSAASAFSHSANELSRLFNFIRNMSTVEHTTAVDGR